MTERQCGDCQLCCKLLPMKAGTEKELHALNLLDRMIQTGMLAPGTEFTPDFDKPSGHRCPHQRHGKGCVIYDKRPFGCRFWNCRWLVNDDTNELPRPDRCHYVIDIAPDFVSKTDDNGKEENVSVVQIWVDPQYRDAYKDPKLRAYMERRGAEGHAILIRYSSYDAFVIFPPALTGGEWVEKRSNICGPEHTLEQKVAALGDYKVVMK